MTRRPACSTHHARWCSTAHEQLVTEYREARFAWERGLEGFHPEHGHMVERADYVADYPPPTFRQWLEGQRGRHG